MKEYHFTEATPLIDFLEKNKPEYIYQTLEELYTTFWPTKNCKVLSDEPVIIKLEKIYLVVHYHLTSDLSIIVCDEEELRNDRNCEKMLQIKNEVFDYYYTEFGEGEEKDSIEGCKITQIDVERFSHAFEWNTSGDMRPSGGDYFSSIRLHLESGKTLCFRGVSAELDGYVEIWCV